MPMFELDFENYLRSRGTSVKKSFFTIFFRRGIQILKKEGKLKKVPQGGTVHLVILSDDHIAQLNKMYRHKEGPTDVLSFSYYENAGFPGQNLIGEIVISLETAEKQAKEHHKTLKEELQFLFAHGLLHLFGYDHERAEERKIMFDLQEEILETRSWRGIIGS